jgi:hypothetical protein
VSEKTILITLPDHDDTVYYLSSYSEPIVKAAEQKGMRRLVLKGRRANRAEFESHVKKNKPDFVVFNGHGSAEEVAGQDNDYLVKCSQNEKLLGGKVVYARACSSLALLGKSCVDKGAKAYAGYKDSFVFITDRNSMANPMRDSFAKPFFECSNVVPISLVKGDDVGAACEKAQMQYKKTIRSLYFKGGPDAPYLLANLLWNMGNEGFEGDPKATI